MQPVEIIELSCCVLETARGAVVAEFQSYCRPTERPQLDPFCVALTGITQEQVDAAPPLAGALAAFERFLAAERVPPATTAAATWGPWDLQVALPMEAKWRGLRVTPLLCAWVDLKRAFVRHFKRVGNLRACVEAAGLRWRGRAHSGLDDARNEAALAALMMARGVRLEVAGRFPESAPHYRRGPPLLLLLPDGGGGGVGDGADCSSGGGDGGQAAEEAAGGHAVAQPGPSIPPPGAPHAPAGSSGGSPRSAASGGQRLLAPLGPRKRARTHGADGRFLGVCECGVPAASRTVKRPGPNHGREFWSCGNWRMVPRGGGARGAGGGKEPCGFFLWK